MSTGPQQHGLSLPSPGAAHRSAKSESAIRLPSPPYDEEATVLVANNNSNDDDDDDGGDDANSPAPTTPSLHRPRLSISSTVPFSARAAARRPKSRFCSMSQIPRVMTTPADLDMMGKEDSSGSDTLRGRGSGDVRNESAVAAATDEFDAARAAENAALIAQLKDQVARSESVSEQYQKQLGVLQSRLDEAVAEQSRLEEAVHGREDTVAALQKETKELNKRIRELDQAYSNERHLYLKDRDEASKREEDLHATVRRLRETISTNKRVAAAESSERQARSSRDQDRHCEEGNAASFPTSLSSEGSPSRTSAQILLHKDKIIESLRLDLAAAQVRIEELETGRVHDLEQQLADARASNARLVEDNESYQLLLHEQALKGHFGISSFAFDEARKRLSVASTEDGFLSSSSGAGAGATGTGATPGAEMAGLGSLADELESFQQGATEEAEERRRLETENKNLKDQNRALTLYIEKIIGRLLQHDGYERILAKNDDEPSGTGNGNDNDNENDVTTTTATTATTPDTSLGTSHITVETDKDLPPSPAVSEFSLAPSTTAAASTRLRPASMIYPPNHPQRLNPPKTRATSLALNMPPRPENPSTFENPVTAPRISFKANRVRVMHRRARSDQVVDPAAASVVSQMYRGPPSGPLSPSLSSPLSQPGPALFSPGAASTTVVAAAAGMAAAPGTRSSFQSSITSLSTSGSGTGTGTGTGSGSERGGTQEQAAAKPPDATGNEKDASTRRISQTLSLASERTGDVTSTDGGGGSSSPTRSVMNNYPGAITGQSKLRPLRLVQEDEAAAAARKKANRGSWMSWFKKEDGAQPQ
ncbi:hypothetical protein KEM52_006743 [Ascosphaera acerosa]|nr:hypothetical protein KEM52_006743 [Ascosphaera acerosa]